MILLPCPWCGPRNVDEFHHLGEVAPRPAPDRASRSVWRAYLYLRDNPCGWVRERWYHRAGCRRVLTLERHTLTNAVRGGEGDPA